MGLLASRNLRCACGAAVGVVAVLGFITTGYSYDADSREYLFKSKAMDGKWVAENENLEVVVRLKFVYPEPWDGTFVVGNMRVKNKVLGTTRTYSLGKTSAQTLEREKSGLYCVGHVVGSDQAETNLDKKFKEFSFTLDIEAETLQINTVVIDDFWRCKRWPITMTRE